MGTNLLTAYGRWVVRHRWTVLAAVFATTVLLGRAATHLRVEVDPDRQLPQDHPFIQTLNDVHRIFGDKNLVVVGLFPHDGNVFTPAFLTKLTEVTEPIRRIPDANRGLLQSLAAPQVKAIRGTSDGSPSPAAPPGSGGAPGSRPGCGDRKSTRLNSSHVRTSY